MVDCLRKKITALFKEEGLSIATEGGSKIVDFLDVVLNLNDGSHHPFVKPNTRTTYVSTSSNHPKIVLDRIQEGVAKRLSVNSSDAEKFRQHTAHFDNALKESGHPGNMSYIEEASGKGKKKRKRNVIWFNPPWCHSIRTKVGGRFLALVRKHFGKGKPLYHLFNEKKLKLSYSTAPNVKQFISAHNKKVIARHEGRAEPTFHGCNCNGGVEECPLSGNCLKPGVVYKATLDMEGESKYYVGQTKNSFKSRWRIHDSDTNRGRRRCRLSTYIIDQKTKGKEPRSLKWEVLTAAKQRKRGDKHCHLCLSEKAFIARGDEQHMLNKRSDIMERCRHKDELMLSNFLSTKTKEERRTKREERRRNDEMRGRRGRTRDWS